MKVQICGKFTSVYTSDKSGVTYVGTTDIESLTACFLHTRTIPCLEVAHDGDGAAGICPMNQPSPCLW